MRFRRLGGGMSKGEILVAPFGPKIFTLAASFVLERVAANRAVEIAHVSGFQYLSVYSLGIGEMRAFSLGEVP
ncbi:MAG: hypothetical protein IPJ11_07470 [Gemmatimonadetes bacterium]|nr:hypothetical protein [Gemmatimonadota bacterium]